MTKLPIGISDYKHLIESDYYYVDKTLLVREIIDVGGAVALICRPRRFGKTLNLSMLHYFFEKTESSNAYLFTDKAIWRDSECRALQGQYPVIFLTFKDVKEKTWEIAYEKLVLIIAKEYKRHQSLIELHAQSINSNDLELYHNIAAQKARFVDVSQSLQFLSMLLQTITKKRVIILLDEYDTPIHAAYSNNYYGDMVDFLRGFLSAGLKDNACLERAVLTGILRTAKEGVFSGLNNLNVCTVLHNSFADKFGFVSHEVDALFKDQDIVITSETIKNWYNGYHVGDNVLLYNPWSIIECVKNKGELRAYWVNTSDNSIIKNVIACSSEEIKKELGMLLTHESLIKDMNEGFAFSETQDNSDALWSLLLFTGYVTYSHRTLTKKGKYSCSLVIPNNEIQTLYEDFLN